MCTVCVQEPTEVRGGKAPLKLEVQMVESHHVGAVKQTPVLRQRVIICPALLHV